MISLIKFYQKHQIWLWPLGLLIIFYFFQYLALKNHSQSFFFQDETEHLTPGWMIADYGKQLYTDLSTNHQPLPIYFGALLMKLIKFNSLFQLIERVRLSMWLFGGLVGVYSVIRFRWAGLLSSVWLQSLAYFYFGWHVLAESLVAPVIGVMVLTLAKYYFGQVKTQWQRFDAIIMGLSSWWLLFNLLPTWPFVGVAGLAFWLKIKPRYRWWLIMSLILPTLILLNTFSPAAWFEETFYNLIHYFLPYDIQVTHLDYLKFLILPWLGIFHPMSQVARFMAGGMILALFAVGRLNFLKKINWWYSLGLYALIVLLNLRVAAPSSTFYTGFHLYPFMGGLSALFAYFVVEVFLQEKTKKRWIWMGLASLLLINNLGWWWETKDKLNEHQIQYGTQQAIANAVKVIKDDDDRLLTGANGFGFINILGEIPLAGRQNFYLNWAWRVPKLRWENQTLMENHPPEFIFFIPHSSDYYQSMKIEENYIELVRTDGTHTHFFVHPDKISEISDQQWQALQAQYFQIPGWAETTESDILSDI